MNGIVAQSARGPRLFILVDDAAAKVVVVGTLRVGGSGPRRS